MDFVALILVVLVAVAFVLFTLKRNRGTKHAADLRPDTPESKIIAGVEADGRPATRSEDRGRAS